MGKNVGFKINRYFCPQVDAKMDNFLERARWLKGQPWQEYAVTRLCCPDRIRINSRVRTRAPNSGEMSRKPRCTPVSHCCRVTASHRPVHPCATRPNIFAQLPLLSASKIGEEFAILKHSSLTSTL